MLLTMARGYAAPLGDNPANNGLKELLKTAEIAQKRDRVVVTTTVTPSLLAGLASGENSAPERTTGADQGASK